MRTWAVGTAPHSRSRGRHVLAGWKGSFNGDLHMYGNAGVQFYTQQKTVSCQLASGPRMHWPPSSQQARKAPVNVIKYLLKYVYTVL